MWFVTIVLSIFVLLDLLWAFLACRALRHGKWSRRWLALPLGWLAVQFTFLYLVIASRGGFNDAVPGWAVTLILATTFIWHLLVLPVTLVSLGAAMALRGLWKLATRRKIRHPEAAAIANPAQPQEVTHPAKDQELLWTRRAVVGMGLAAAPPVLAGGLTWRGLAELDALRVRHMDVPIANLPEPLIGLKIAHLTDTHVGELTRGKKLKEIAERTNLLKPDLIFLTGDLINRSLSDLPAAMDMVNRMESRYGIAMCEGNHDLFQGRAGFVEGVRQAGVPLLIDASLPMTVRGVPIDVLGVGWHGRRGGRGGRDVNLTEDQANEQAVAKLAKGVRDGAFPILLAHHPHVFDPAARLGIPLTLAGHTHGGQLHLSHHIGFGPLMFKYWSGLYQQAASALVVGNGTGNWFPVRSGAPAEIISITLKRA